MKNSMEVSSIIGFLKIHEGYTYKSYGDYIQVWDLDNDTIVVECLSHLKSWMGYCLISF